MAHNAFDAQMGTFGRRLLEIQSKRDAVGLRAVIEEMEKFRVEATGLLPIQYGVLHATLNELHMLSNQIQD